MNLVNQDIKRNAPLSLGEVIGNLIDDDIKSPKKRNMFIGEEYYNLRNVAINKKERTYWSYGEMRKDLSSPNNKMPSAFNRELIDQAVSFSLKNPITLSLEEEQQQENLSKINKELVKNKLHKHLKKAYKEKRKKGVSWTYMFVNSKGELDFTLMDSEGIIPIYDQSFERELLQVIRYYKVKSVDNSGNEVALNKVEVYDKEKVTYYMQSKEDLDNYIFLTNIDDPTITNNPQYYMQKYNTNKPDEIINYSWGVVPFIRMGFEGDVPDIVLNKKYIDAFDKTVSENQDKVEELADAYFAVKGYNLADDKGIGFMKNLKDRKFVPLNEGGELKLIQQELMFEQKKEYLNFLKQNIYTFGMGVDVNKENFGNISGVALEIQFSNLKMKATNGEECIEQFIVDFYNMVNEYIQLAEKASIFKPIDVESLEINFNRDVTVNTSEIVEMTNKSVGIISRRTILKNHPWVKNIDKELENLKDEEREQMDVYEVEEP